jgi:NAD(P)-dependent dehydrogenase (short-subunit alcohol dehydrogenase family)
MAEAAEVADLVAYLASPRSAVTNGAALRAEGGLVNTIA